MSVSDDILERFPEFSEFLAIPEIKDLIEQAATNSGWTQTMFQNKLWGTNWWKTTPQTARNWSAMKMNDPATAGQTAGNMTAKIHGLTTSLGLPMSSSELAYFSEVAIGQGWTDQTLQQKLVQFAGNKKLLPGQIKANQTQLLKTASDYGVNMGWGTAQKWAAGIADGSRTAEGFAEYARETARKNYPTLAKQLDAGMTVREIADPYVQIAAQTLGINPDTIQLTDPKWQRALQSRNSKGETVGPMTNLDWQRTLMTDKAYDYQHSEQGQKAATDLRNNLAETFGFGAR